MYQILWRYFPNRRTMNVQCYLGLGVNPSNPADENVPIYMSLIQYQFFQ